MHHNNGVHSLFEDGNLDEVSTEGHRNDFQFDKEPHDQLEGHVIHKLSPDQALRLVHHEAATIFSINPADVRRLQNSIEEFEQQVPVVIYEDKVLDGRCRIRACVAIDRPVLAVRFCESDLNGLTPQQWVLHRNRSATDGRRMTDAEFALIVASVYGPQACENALIRKKGGVKVEGELRGEASKALGTTFNVSPNLMKQALKIMKNGDAELVQLVKDKKISLSRATELLNITASERRKAMKDPTAPLPLASADKALAAYKSAIKSLKKFQKRINEITRSKHFSAETRTAIAPSLAQLHDAVFFLQETTPIDAPSEPDA